MALMLDDQRSELLFSIGVAVTTVVCVTGFIYAMIWLDQWTKENAARRCVEYGYECPEED